MSGAIPQEVLGDALAEAIDGRRVHTAVFTTFTFDPGFFELHVLPLLFDRSFHHAESLRRVQLEDALRSVAHLAVYYDRTAIAQDAVPAQLDFRRIDVRRSTGVFHPKVVLLLVENEDEDAGEGDPPLLSLIVGTLSANLTRSGWWENVETGHFEEIDDIEVDDTICSFRPDLLSLIQRMRTTAAEDEEHEALDAVHEFLLRRTNSGRRRVHRVHGRYFTRLFVGQASLPEWLAEIRMVEQDWNLEIISPYFDGTEASTLATLIDTVDPRETRLFLPTLGDGSAAVSEEYYHAAQEAGAVWSTLPGAVLQPGGRNDESAPTRRVHAKVYRFWRKDGRDVVLTGSVNLTGAAHSHGRAGNLEAAFLVDIGDEGYSRRWWLQPLERDASTFSETVEEASHPGDEVFIDISLRFDWSTARLAYRIQGDAAPLAAHDPSGRRLFGIDRPATGRWVDCGDEASAVVHELIASTSFLEVRGEEGAWRVLVREEGMSHKPSMLRQLTPEEILMYWSLLTEEQRAAVIEKIAAGETGVQGLPVRLRERTLGGETVFDRFAGVYHAFGQLQRFVDESIAQDRLRDADARLFGAKFDSLPVLLERTVERDDADPVIAYVTFLCARQLRDRAARRHREYWRSRKPHRRTLEVLLASLPAIRSRVTGPEVDDEFLEWLEKWFLRDAAGVDAA